MLSLVGHPCAVNPDARLRAHAKQQGWRIRDYRTGRKAARAGVFAAAVAGAATGAVAAGVAVRRAGALTPGLCRHSGLHLRVPAYDATAPNPTGAREEYAMTWATTTRRAAGTTCARPCSAAARPAAAAGRRSRWMLLSEATAVGGPPPGGGFDDSDRAASSEESESERSRLIALVELARGGDAEAFGQLYDHYQGSVYRFVYYRTRSHDAWPRTSPPRPSSGRCAA